MTRRVTGGRRPPDPHASERALSIRRRRFAAAFLVAKQLEDPPVDTKVLGEFGVKKTPGWNKTLNTPPIRL